MFTAFKIGMLLGLSIIISIGSQNLFVIKQGLRNDRPYLCAMACFVCDVVLITLGVSGVSVLLVEFPLVKAMLLVAGVAFLLLYGVSAIRRSFNIEAIKESLVKLNDGNSQGSSISKLILLALSFSVLNPQAILDTMVIIGGSANHYADNEKWLFVAGTIAASFVWFTGLATASKFFSKRVMNVAFWRMLEWVSGVSMIGFSAGLIFV